MKIRIIYIFLIGLLFAQCSQKTTAPLVVTPEEPVEAFRSSAPQPGPARAVQLGDYNSFDLDNGLKVIVVENHKLPFVSYSLNLKTQAIKEGDKAGYWQMAGGLLNTGTANRTKAEIDEAVDFIGANFNSSPSGMFGRSLTKHQDALLDIMTDVLYNASFPEEEFDKMVKQMLSGLETTKTDPNAMAGNVASKVIHGDDHPYGEVMTPKTVNNITLDDCKRIFNEIFKPNNAYLTIVGDISPAKARMMANKYFGKWETGEVNNPEFAVSMEPEKTKVVFAHKDGAVQSVIRVTYPVEMKPGAPDVMAATVMNSILGGGIFSGRLMQNLREDKAYTYGARSSMGTNPVVSTFSASASVRNEVTDSSVVEFLYELNRMVNEMVSPEDLALSKSSLAGSFARSLENPQTVARFALNIARYNLPEDYYQTYLERLDAVTIQDVYAAANKYIRPDNAYIVVVGDKEVTAPKLMQFDDDGKIEYYDAFGYEIKESGVDIPEGVNAMTVVKDYLSAIGGEAKLRGVNSMETQLSMDMMGQKININVYQKAPSKMYVRVGNEQMVFSEQKFDGEKAMVGGMGQSQVLTEGPQFEKMKEETAIFAQLAYLDQGYQLDLKGVEEVEGVNCYKVEVVAPSGKKSYEYYNLENSLLIREVSSEEGPGGQSVTVTNDISDYRDVEGVMVPHMLKVTGMMPTPAEMKLNDVKINSDISDDMFTIE